MINIMEVQDTRASQLHFGISPEKSPITLDVSLDLQHRIYTQDEVRRVIGLPPKEFLPESVQVPATEDKVTRFCRERLQQILAKKQGFIDRNEEKVTELKERLEEQDKRTKKQEIETSLITKLLEMKGVKNAE